jgi:hypothetical protein
MLPAQALVRRSAGTALQPGSTVYFGGADTLDSDRFVARTVHGRRHHLYRRRMARNWHCQRSSHSHRRNTFVDIGGHSSTVQAFEFRNNIVVYGSSQLRNGGSITNQSNNLLVSSTQRFQSPLLRLVSPPRSSKFATSTVSTQGQKNLL